MEIVKTIALKKSKLILIVSKNNQTTKNPPQCYQHRSGSEYSPEQPGKYVLSKHIIPSLLWFRNQGIFIPLVKYTQKQECDGNETTEFQRVCPVRPCFH